MAGLMHAWSYPGNIEKGNDPNNWPGRWNDLQKLLVRGGPLAHLDFEPGPQNGVGRTLIHKILWPLWRGDNCGEVVIVGSRPLWRGGHCGEVVIVERWPLWRGGHCGEVAIVERWPLWRGGHCGEVANVERWPM
ncbi:hypothetical protein QZH41_019247 [Actinostola sp. cb2023]|nr:hypothetical protein QZH41_019247 [Actinostola sp. cb2023]